MEIDLTNGESVKNSFHQLTLNSGNYNMLSWICQLKVGENNEMWTNKAKTKTTVKKRRQNVVIEPTLGNFFYEK